MTRCPCGSGTPDEECCTRFLGGVADPATAEALMRSRFTAHVRHDGPYLRRTWHPSTRPRTITFDDSLHWLRLDIVARTAGGLLDSTGTVDFRAHYDIDGRRQVLAENSRFVRENGHWLYLAPH